MGRQLAPRRSLVCIFLSLAHSPTEHGPETHACSISSRTPYLLIFGNKTAMKWLNRVQNTDLSSCTYQVN